MIQLVSAPAELQRPAELQGQWSRVLGRPEIGFPSLTARDQDWRAIQDRAAKVGKTERVTVIGVGGSSLGTQAIYQTFQSREPARFTFLESPDPGVVPGETRDQNVVIVSKSGNTLETLAWIERMHAIDPQWWKRSKVTVIASPGAGHLQRWAEREKIPVLWFPENVGGRFSVLSAVGMFPAALMGLDILGFRAGAEWALTQPGLSARLAGEALRAWERDKWISQMWLYTDGLRVFGEWWQQLWSESLAKKSRRDGTSAPRVSSPMACQGPRDQHSLLQQLVDGASDKHVFVTRVKSVEESDGEFVPELFAEMPYHGRALTLGRILSAEARAFERTLEDRAIPYCSIRVDDLSEKGMGALFMLWQMAVAQLGEHLNIDAFNQPGVELGKIHAGRILRSGD